MHSEVSVPATRLAGMTFHPWRALRKRAHIRVSWVRMPVGELARTNGVDLIWMDQDLLQVERRCTLTHELIHIEQGHTRCQTPKVERRVRAETARRLITMDALCSSMRWALSFEELADELWVTPRVLSDRVLNFTPEEVRIVARLEGQEC